MANLTLSPKAVAKPAGTVFGTVADYYAQYDAQVRVDGGTIMEPTFVRGFIDLLISMGLNPADAVLVAPRAGARIVGGRIEALYSLDGSKFVPTDDSGAALTFGYDASAGWGYKVAIQAGPNTYLRSVAPKLFCPSDRCYIGLIAAVPASGADRRVAWAFDPFGADGNSHLAVTHNFDGAWRMTGYVRRSATSQLVLGPNSEALSGKTLTAYHFDTGMSQVGQRCINGILRAEVLTNSGTVLEPLSQWFGYLCLGGRLGTGGARYNFDNSGGSNIGVGLLVPGATIDQTVAISTWVKSYF